MCFHLDAAQAEPDEAARLCLGGATTSKDIAAFREIFKRKQVLAKEKRRVSDGIEIYEYRNGSLWCGSP